MPTGIENGQLAWAVLSGCQAIFCLLLLRTMDNLWKNVAVGFFFVVCIFGYSQLRTDNSSQEKVLFREQAPVQEVKQPQRIEQPQKVQPTKKDEDRVAKNKLNKEYAEVHAKSYDKLAESLEFMGMANESMRTITAAYYEGDDETMFAGMFIHNTALERARESVQESKRLITNVQVPDNIRSLHNKWIALIADFKRLPDDYAEIMPKVVDGKVGAVEDAEALAIEMLELPQRAIDISQKIVTALSN
ncbi:MAG: hypothetical protein ABIG34_04060 [Candidatus Peregrinibacteria bacterium]